MPQIKIKHVVSVSNEEKNYPAENLIKSEGYKKWRAKAGEKTASVTLQFNKSESIHQIDVGNENSAFIEVLVGKSTSKDDFQVILVASSFMSPTEARNSQNGSRVRIFDKDKLSKAVVDEKWDQVKVVCTQPFNKTVEFGLAFIKFHGTPEPGEEEKKETKLGAFSLRPDECSEPAVKPGSLFAKKDKPEPVPLTGAAAMRAASKLADEAAPSTSAAQAAPVPRRRSSADSERPSLKRHSTGGSSRRESPPPLKKAKTEPARPEKPFHRLLERVTFVMSGYQNPERGKLRDHALEMGATYKPDWGKGCTHLVCAFENTPKYEQVKGKGRIVTKDWVRHCYKQRKLMPWRKYRLGRAPSPRGGSSSESEDEAPRPVKQEAKPAAKERKPSRPAESSEDEDTEDELERLAKGDSSKDNSSKDISSAPGPSRPTKNGSQTSVYDESTDEEAPNDEDWDALPLPDLPHFFRAKTFFLYGAWQDAARRTVRRYVTAYDGALEEYMSDSVTHVITDAPWDDNFDQALSDNPNLHFVRPEWIHACYDKQKLLPHQKFVVVPS